jgi:arsenate reductase
MAEGLLRSLGKGEVESFSAGDDPAGVHPMAIDVMSEMGIDISTHSSKHLDGFRQEKFDYVITVCDRIKEACPTWPDAQEHIHWSFEDPATVTEPTRARRAFVAVRSGIAHRIRLFLAAHKIGVGTPAGTP